MVVSCGPLGTFPIFFVAPSLGSTSGFVLEFYPVAPKKIHRVGDMKAWVWWKKILPVSNNKGSVICRAPRAEMADHIRGVCQPRLFMSLFTVKRLFHSHELHTSYILHMIQTSTAIYVSIKICTVHHSASQYHCSSYIKSKTHTSEAHTR